MIERERYVDMLKALSEKLNDNEESMNMLKEMQEDYDEREVGKIDESFIKDTDGITWKEKYEDMRAKYRDRFFSPPVEAVENVSEMVEPDIDEPKTDLTFDDLFAQRERKI